MCLVTSILRPIGDQCLSFSKLGLTKKVEKLIFTPYTDTYRRGNRKVLSFSVSSLRHSNILYSLTKSLSPL